MPDRFSVLALIFDPERRAGVERALHGRAQVAVCGTPAELHQRVMAVDPDVVLVELRDDEGAALTPTIAALHAVFPLLPIVAGGPFTLPLIRDLVPAVRAGVDDVLLLGTDDPYRKLQSVVASAPYASAVRRVLRRAGPLVPEAVAPMFRVCLESAGAHVLVEDVARALGVSPKTLAVRCARAGAPSPRKLIGWSKLLVAAKLMEQRGLAVEKIAHALGLESGAALRNLLRRYTGLRPSEVRAQGGLACLLRLFRVAFAKAAVGGDTEASQMTHAHDGAATRHADQILLPASDDDADHPPPPPARSPTDRAS